MSASYQFAEKRYMVTLCCPARNSVDWKRQFRLVGINVPYGNNTPGYLPESNASTTLYLGERLCALFSLRVGSPQRAREFCKAPLLK
jgi:hypothetical protein